MHRCFAAAAAGFVLLLGAKAACASSVSQVGATVPQFTQAATLLGAANPEQKVRLVVFLAYPNHAAVDQFTAAVNDPSSPEYGEFLTPAQFSAAYGPSPHSYTMVEYELQGGGFEIVHTYANDKVIDVIGTVAAADAFFDTVIDYYSYNNVTYYANSVPALLPSAFDGLVMTVSGLNNFVQRYGTPLASSLPPGPTGYGPLDIETAYNEPVHVNAHTNGSGATIAVETAYDYLNSDLSAYWSEYGVSRSWTIRSTKDCPHLSRATKRRSTSSRPRRMLRARTSKSTRLPIRSTRRSTISMRPW
jgi:subtilase family serine protease